LKTPARLGGLAAGSVFFGVPPGSDVDWDAGFSLFGLITFFAACFKAPGRPVPFAGGVGLDAGFSLFRLITAFAASLKAPARLAGLAAGPLLDGIVCAGGGGE